MKRKSFFKIIICLICAMLLAGCGSSMPGKIDPNDKPEKINEETEEDGVDSGKDVLDAEITEDSEKEKKEKASEEDVTITDVSWNFGSYEEFSENDTDIGEVYFKLSNGEIITKQVPLGYYVTGKEDADIDGDGEDEIIINQYFANTSTEYNIVYIFKLTGGDIEDISPMGDIPELTDDVADMMIKPLDKDGYPKYALDVITYQKDSTDVSVKYHALLAWHNGSWEEIGNTEETGQIDTAGEHTIRRYVG